MVFSFPERIVGAAGCFRVACFALSALALYILLVRAEKKLLHLFFAVSKPVQKKQGRPCGRPVSFSPRLRAESPGVFS
jgi:hypothetical protein